MNPILFFCETLTKDWTRRDWAINVIPLGGAISVAYEVGSACLSHRDQTTKISQDFFKSPIHVVLKKMAQCCWVPTVICGALKLICLVITICWNRCFPYAEDSCKKISDTRAEDPCKKITSVMMLNVFSYLHLEGLGVSRRVTKGWRELARTPHLWKAVIYREVAFSSKNWAQLDNEIVKDVDFTKEQLSLPDNITEELGRSYDAFPGRGIKKTHVLVRMPKGLTINKLIELAKKFFPDNARNPLVGFISSVVKTLGDKSAEEPVWLLMSTQEVRGTQGESEIRQKQIVGELAKRVLVPYDIPTTLEAFTCFLARFSHNLKDLRANNIRIFCQEYVEGSQVAICSHIPHAIGLFIFTRRTSERYGSTPGAVVLRRF